MKCVRKSAAKMSSDLDDSAGVDACMSDDNVPVKTRAYHVELIDVRTIYCPYANGGLAQRTRQGHG